MNGTCIHVCHKHCLNFVLKNTIFCFLLAFQLKFASVPITNQHVEFLQFQLDNNKDIII